MGAKLQAAITQMNSGKIAPVMEGRTDVQIYPYSCRETKNAIPLVYGSNKNRGGSAFVSAVKNSANKTALIPFKVGENVAYQIEIGDEYLRFYKDRELILDDGEPYELETSYQVEDIFDANGLLQIDYQQSGDVLYLVHDKYPPMKLSRYGDTNWVLSALDLQGGPWQNMNTEKGVKIKSSADTGIATLTVLGASDYVETINIPPMYRDVDDVPQRADVTVSVGNTTVATGDRNSFVLNQGQYALCDYVKNILEVNGTGFSCEIIEEDNTHKLKIKSNTTSYANQTLTVQIYYKWGGIFEETKTSTSDFGAVIENERPPIFTYDMIGQLIRLRTANSGSIDVWYAGMTVSVDMIVRSDGNFYKAETSGTAGNIKPTHTEGTESDGKVFWTYLHSGYAWGKIVSYINSYTVKAEFKTVLPSDVVSGGTDRWEIGLNGADGIWPSSVCFFKDRLALGLNATKGPQVCFSCSGDYENFSDMTAGEVLATNAITLPILLDLNKIQWLCAQDNLFVGTEGGIVAVKAMTSSEVFGPDNITYDNISSVGACKIKPIRIGDDILYLGRLAKDIYAIQYNWETDSYAPDEVSLLAYDLLEEGISGWALQYEPNRIIWLVRKDGKLLGLTYNKKQSVRAFHLHETDGQFESVSCIPAPDGTQDEVYFVAKRIVNSNTVRYVEYFKNGLPLSIASGLTVAQKLEYLIKNAWFLDCAKKYTFAEATDAITGLTHLEGKTVAVLADGNVQESKTVASGAITLDSAAKLVLVGLPYETIIEPMPLNIDINGTGQARSQRINQIICRLYRSANFKFSWDNATWHNAEVKEDNELTLKSGDLLLNWGASNTLSKLNSEDIVNATGARMLFKQDLPLPVCFVAFYPQIEVSNG